MKKLLLTLSLLMITGGMLLAQGSFFSKTDAFMRAHVDGYGQVDYAGIKASPAGLKSLVDQVASFNYSGASASSKKAFLINAYNILMIKSVVESYPIDKPTDVAGIFDQKKHKVAGMSLTLSDIENKKLRVDFPDARLHFVLVCGARSCPPLANFGFFPEKLDAQLTSRTKLAMNNKFFIRYKPESKKVLISKIFEWYKPDFDREAKSFIAYINKYRSNAIPAGTTVGFYEYNWALNGKKK